MLITDQKLYNIPNLLIENSVVTQVSSAKFLGIVIDDRLNFKIHINRLCNRLAFHIGVIRRISKFLPTETLQSLYFSFIQSHLCFGLPVWGSCAPTNLRRVISLQRRALQLCQSNRTALGFTQLYNYTCMSKFMKDYIFGIGRPLCDISRFFPNHMHNTRFRIGLNLSGPTMLKTKCQQSYVYCACKQWNTLPVYLRDCSTMKIFKKLFKAYLLVQH